MTDTTDQHPEPADAGDDEGVPTDALEAFEALEYARAVQATSGGES